MTDDADTSIFPFLVKLEARRTIEAHLIHLKEWSSIDTRAQRVNREARQSTHKCIGFDSRAPNRICICARGAINVVTINDMTRVKTSRWSIKFYDELDAGRIRNWEKPHLQFIVNEYYWIYYYMRQTWNLLVLSFVVYTQTFDDIDI